MPSVTELNALNLDLVIKGTSRSFIINFSSGTTGKPKAVGTFHRSLVANITLTSQSPWYPSKKSKQQERSLMVIPLFHGYGGIMVYHSLYNGELVVTMSRFKPKEFLQALQDYKVEPLNEAKTICESRLSFPSDNVGIFSCTYYPISSYKFNCFQF